MSRFLAHKFMLFSATTLLSAVLVPCAAYAGSIDNETINYGSACTGNKDAVDWDTIAECSSSVWVRAPLFIGPGPSPNDNCDSAHAGMVVYDTTYNLLKYCNGLGSWTYL